MTTSQSNTRFRTAFLCRAIRGDEQKTKSLCCAAAGIFNPISASTEAFISHEKLREAAPPDATLTAKNRPPAQLVVGYKHLPRMEAT